MLSPDKNLRRAICGSVCQELGLSGKRHCILIPPRGCRFGPAPGPRFNPFDRDVLMAVRIEAQAEPITGYRLIERLGGGGFGEVWKAEAPGGLHKAIKFVFGEVKTPENADEGQEGHRAEQELKALTRVKTVRHPYILSLARF